LRHQRGVGGADGGAFFALRSCHQLLGGDSGEFFSPDYLCSNPPLWCNWTVRAEPGRRLHLQLEDLTPDRTCHLKRDQIHVDEPAGGEPAHRVLRGCWREAKFTSASNTLHVVLLIAGRAAAPYRGFHARYRAFGPPDQESQGNPEGRGQRAVQAENRSLLDTLQTNASQQPPLSDRTEPGVDSTQKPPPSRESTTQSTGPTGPRTQSTGPRTQSTESRTQSTESRTQSTESSTQSTVPTESTTQSTEPRTQITEPTEPTHPHPHLLEPLWDPRDRVLAPLSRLNLTGSVLTVPDVNECGTQLVLCDVNADCVNQFGSYSCRCRPGFQDQSRLGSGGTVCVDLKASGTSGDGEPSGLSPETKGVYVLFFLLSCLILMLLAAAAMFYHRRHRGAFLVRCHSSGSVSPQDLNNNRRPLEGHCEPPPPPPPPARGHREGWPPAKDRRPAADLPLLRFSPLLPPGDYVDPHRGAKP
uniref:EGF-like domain-containing protein n=1 Tax=Salarias fasciatus TaxID=181472 RepID=A0A672FIJ9_SALFA